MDRKSVYIDLTTKKKPINQICQEYESLLKIKHVTEQEIARNFRLEFGKMEATMHIQRHFTPKVAKVIIAQI